MTEAADKVNTEFRNAKLYSVGDQIQVDRVRTRVLQIITDVERERDAWRRKFEQKMEMLYQINKRGH